MNDRSSSGWTQVALSARIQIHQYYILDAIALDLRNKAAVIALNGVPFPVTGSVPVDRGQSALAIVILDELDPTAIAAPQMLRSSCSSVFGHGDFLPQS